MIFLVKLIFVDCWLFRLVDDWTIGALLGYNNYNTELKIMLWENLFFHLRDLIENSPAKRDRIVFISFVFSLLVSVSSLIFIFFNFWRVNDYIILRYNIYFGISSLGFWARLLWLPGFGLLVTLLNFFLSFKLFLKDKLPAYFLAISSAFVNLLIIIALGLIFYINL